MTPEQERVNEDQSELLVKHVRDIKQLPVANQINRVHNKARNHEQVRQLLPWLNQQPRFPPNDNNADNDYSDDRWEPLMLRRIAHATYKLSALYTERVRINITFVNQLVQ